MRSVKTHSRLERASLRSTCQHVALHRSLRIGQKRLLWMTSVTAFLVGTPRRSSDEISLNDERELDRPG
jgi:hypothetical protein